MCRHENHVVHNAGKLTIVHNRMFLNSAGVHNIAHVHAYIHKWIRIMRKYINTPYACANADTVVTNGVQMHETQCPVQALGHRQTSTSSPRTKVRSDIHRSTTPQLHCITTLTDLISPVIDQIVDSLYTNLGQLEYIVVQQASFVFIRVLIDGHDILRAIVQADIPSWSDLSALNEDEVKHIS